MSTKQPPSWEPGGQTSDSEKLNTQSTRSLEQLRGIGDVPTRKCKHCEQPYEHPYTPLRGRPTLFCTARCMNDYERARQRATATARRGDPFPDPGDEDSPDTLFAEDVRNKAYDMRVRAKARELLDAEETARTAMLSFDAGTLEEILARDPEPPHRVDGLIPTEASTLIVAMRKTGKTTLALNLARSLILGEDFLGRFATRAITGRIGLLNYEVTGSTLARWAKEALIPQDRLYIENLRGRRNPLGHLGDREQLADRLRDHQVEALIVDPFGRVYTGKSQNDSGEVGAFLADLDVFARSEVGASDLILTAHAGWEGERTRGASALEDWADSIITLTRRKAGPDEDEDHHRYLKAEGRDVEIDEDRLEFEPSTRLLTMTGLGSRRKASGTQRVEALIPAVVAYVTENPTCSQNDIEKGVEGRGPDVRAASKKAAELGLITRTQIGRRVSHMAAAPEGASGASQVRPGRSDVVRPLRLLGTQDAHTPQIADTDTSNGTQYCRTCEPPPNRASPGHDQCASCRAKADQ